MARSHARIYTSIWDDADFLALTGDAQRCYLMLLSQPNLNHAGVMATTIRRWTLLRSDETEDGLRAALSELSATRFVLIDERTEELLIRTLIRNDGVWKQPKVLAVALGEAASVRSATLRACVVEELARINPADAGDKTRGDVEALLKDLPQRLANARAELLRQAPPQAPTDPPPHPPVEGDGALPLYPPGEELAEGVRVRAGAAPTPSPSPAVQLPAVADEPRQADAGLTPTQRSKRLTDAYAEAEPMCKWPAVNGVVLSAIKSGRFKDEEIRDALLRMAAEGRSVTIDSLRTELQGFPAQSQRGTAAAGPVQSTGAVRAAAAIEAGRRVQAKLDERNRR